MVNSRSKNSVRKVNEVEENSTKSAKATARSNLASNDANLSAESTSSASSSNSNNQVADKVPSIDNETDKVLSIENQDNNNVGGMSSPNSLLINTTTATTTTTTKRHSMAKHVDIDENDEITNSMSHHHLKSPPPFKKYKSSYAAENSYETQQHKYKSGYGVENAPDSPPPKYRSGYAAANDIQQQKYKSGYTMENTQEIAPPRYQTSRAYHNIYPVLENAPPRHLPPPHYMKQYMDNYTHNMEHPNMKHHYNMRSIESYHGPYHPPPSTATATATTTATIVEKPPMGEHRSTEAIGQNPHDNNHYPYYNYGDETYGGNYPAAPPTFARKTRNDPDAYDNYTKATSIPPIRFCVCFIQGQYCSPCHVVHMVMHKYNFPCGVKNCELPINSNNGGGEQPPHPYHQTPWEYPAYYNHPSNNNHFPNEYYPQDGYYPEQSKFPH